MLVVEYCYIFLSGSNDRSTSMCSMYQCSNNTALGLSCQLPGQQRRQQGSRGHEMQEKCQTALTPCRWDKCHSATLPGD